MYRKRAIEVKMERANRGRSSREARISASGAVSPWLDLLDARREIRASGVRGEALRSARKQANLRYEGQTAARRRNARGP